MGAQATAEEGCAPWPFAFPSIGWVPLRFDGSCGGIRTALRRLARGMLRFRHEMVVMSPPPFPPAQLGSAALTAEQQQAREQALTQHHAARLRIDAHNVVLKYDDTFLVGDAAGDMLAEEGHGLGLFYRDTRYLSVYVLSLDGQRLYALSSEQGGGSWVTHALETEDLEEATDDDPHSIAVRRYRTAGDGEIRELLLISNHAMSAAQLRLRLKFQADFADIFQVRSLAPYESRQERGSRADGETATLWSVGQDRRHRSTALRFKPAPAQFDGGCATFELRLDSGQSAEVEIQVLLHESQPGGDGEARPPGSTRHGAFDPRALKGEVDPQGQELLESATQLQSHPQLEALVRRSLLDLSLLSGRLRSDLRYIAAGVPWFVTLFGRDAAICGLQLCAWSFDIAGDTIRLLASRQADRVDAFRDAQPGKILHELRRGQLSRLDAIPQSPAYYGSLDATLLFIIVMDAYLAWSGDVDGVRELRPNLDAALGWIDHYADSDGRRLSRLRRQSQLQPL